MTRIRITPRLGAVVVAGLVLANSAAVAQPVPTAPPPNLVPAARPVTGATLYDAVATPPVPTAVPQTVPVPEMVPQTVPVPVVSRLDADTEEDIREELLDMKEDSGSATAAVLRPKLMAKAESMAAESLGITTAQLAQHPTIRRQLRAIVRSVLPTATTTPSSGQAQTPPSEPRRTRKSADDDGDAHRRCDCIYCQPSRHTGACASSCPTPCLPTLPTAACYPATPYYLVPYAYSPKHHGLHGLLCPCTWCRGRW